MVERWIKPFLFDGITNEDMLVSFAFLGIRFFFLSFFLDWVSLGIRMEPRCNSGQCRCKST